MLHAQSCILKSNQIVEIRRLTEITINQSATIRNLSKQLRKAKVTTHRLSQDITSQHTSRVVGNNNDRVGMFNSTSTSLVHGQRTD